MNTVGWSKLRAVVFFLLVSLLLAERVCATEPDIKLSVLSSIRPLALLAEEVGGSNVRVSTLLPAGQSPHHYSLRFSDRRQIADAVLVIWVGPSTEPFLDKTLNRVNHLAMASSTHRHHDHDHEGDHFEGHPWLDPVLVARFAGRLAEELGRLQPARSAEFQTRAERVVERINSLKFDVLEARRNYVVTHNAFEELLSSFSLPDLECRSQLAAALVRLSPSVATVILNQRRAVAEHLPRAT